MDTHARRTRRAELQRARPRAVAHAAVGSLEVVHLRFPPSFGHGVVDPPTGYLAVGLAGAVCKRFCRAATTLTRGSVLSVPAGAAHASAFGPSGFDVLLVRPVDEEAHALFGSLLGDRRHVSAGAAGVLAWQLAGELRSRDAASALAVEGLTLELLARVGRAVARPTDERTQPWAEAARDLLDGASPRLLTLQELGSTLGRHPGRIARAFRREFGITVAEYARWRRLEWATTALVSTDDPLARIALDAGFADQSHFTRCFRRHHGVTPGRYRELVRA